MRYYRCTPYLSARRFGEAVLGRRGIESMHRVLDVNMKGILIFLAASPGGLDARLRGLVN